MSEHYSEVGAVNASLKEISLSNNIQIRACQQFDEQKVRDLVNKNIASFEESQTILSAMYRRLGALYQTYAEPGCYLLIASESTSPSEPIGLVGIGPLHGLDFAEKIGEIRDLVVADHLRGKGIGKDLLRRCIEYAKDLGYRRLYLETSPSMTVAQKLFVRTGFKPVKEKTDTQKGIASYFIMESL